METSKLYQLYLQHPSVQTDTRKLKPGDIYWALSGPNFDGNSFVGEAFKKGAVYAVIDNPAYNTGGNCVVVTDALSALQQLALYHRRQLNIPFIAITGSNGKTTTKELTAAVLSKKYITYATEGNLNNHIGIPLTILKIKTNAEIAIIEMGANHVGEIASYCTIALPGYGVITNCGKAHIEGFGGVEGVRKGKGELYDFIRANNGTIFRYTALSYLEGMAHGIRQQVTYGTEQGSYTGKPFMDNVFLNVGVNTNDNETIISTHLAGDYNFANVMAAVAIGLHFGVQLHLIKEAIEQYYPDNSRSQWIQKDTNRIILDAYNANPSSMQAAILNFAAANLPHKMLWIGGMKEMGTAEAEEHDAIIELIGRYEWESVILVGKEFINNKSNYKWFENSANAATFIKENMPRHSSILIKGSRGSKMEIMADVL